MRFLVTADAAYLGLLTYSFGLFGAFGWH